MPTKEDLLAKNAAYDAETWGDYEALYKGGKAVKARIGRFLPQNPQEPAEVYAARKACAHYRCYLGSIIDYFAAYLVTSPIVVRAKRDGATVDPDDFYTQFKEDCDARDNDVMLFMRRRITDALTKKRSWWLVEMPKSSGSADEPAPEDRAEWERLGLGKGHLCALDAEQVLDWDIDDAGQLLWARVYSCSKRRLSAISKTKTVTERWEVFERSTVTVYALTYPEDTPPAATVEVPVTEKARPHGFDCVPMLSIDLDDGLWLANRLESPQVENLQLANALHWAIRRTCYAMPVLYVEGDKDPVMGTGYYLRLGVKDRFEWSAPPATPYAEIRESAKDQKDEIYRVIHAMALGVNNNAAAVGRSAESKVADGEVVRVILTSLGAVVREAIERSYAMLSQARGDKYEWAIEGLDTFDEVDASKMLEAITEAVLLNIPSKTFMREVKTRAAMAVLPGSSQDVKDAIKEEIDAREPEPPTHLEALESAMNGGPADGGGSGGAGRSGRADAPPGARGGAKPPRPGARDAPRPQGGAR